MRPRKYFCATMFVAVCDQNFGNSTPRCSKTGLSLPGIRASRISHSISSNGSRPGLAKNRRTAALADSFETAFSSSAGASSCELTSSTDATIGVGRIKGRPWDKPAAGLTDPKPPLRELTTGLETPVGDRRDRAQLEQE